MIDASFVEAIQKRVATQLIEAEGRNFTTSPVHNLPFPAEPKVATLSVETLTGLVDYCKQLSLDGLDPAHLLLHVENYREVHLLSKLTGVTRFRDMYLEAACANSPFQFGSFMQHSAFMIALQSMFQDFGDRSKVAKVIGTLKAEEARTSQDNGMTQRVTATAGIAVVAEVDVPNPVLLKPWRTFPEIEQPPSNFVLRVQGGRDTLPQIALFEADGGMWKREAALAIREYLKANIPNIAIIA